VRKTVKYLRIASVPVKIRTGQHLNTNIDCNGHINLLASTDDRDRKKKTYNLFGRSKGKGPPPKVGVDG